MGVGPAGGQAGPAPTPALDLTHSGSFPLSAVTSARLPQVTLAPGSSTDRGKTPVTTAAGPAPDHPDPLTRKRAAGITDTDDVLELLVPLNAVDADVTKEQDPGLSGGGLLDGLGPGASLYPAVEAS